MSMQALRIYGNKDFRVDTIPIPAVKPGWVLVKNAWAGICGSDLHEYTVGPLIAPSEPHILTGEKRPTGMGHEFAGTVETLGEGVTDLHIGQKVAIFPVLTDGTCFWCQSETYSMCEKWGFLGYSGWGGGMAEYVCLERRALVPLPDDMALDVGALIEPLAVGWHAVKKFPVKESDSCLVLGGGPIGIAVVHCLRAFGVSTIVVSEPSTSRAQEAKKAGAMHVLNPLEEDVAAFCRSLDHGRGVHFVYDCAGVQAAYDVGLASVRGLGKIVNVAIFETPLVIKEPNKVCRGQVTISGSSIYTRGEFQEVIDAVHTGRIKKPETMITARIKLKDAVAEGFEELLAHKDKHIKILINPYE